MLEPVLLVWQPLFLVCSKTRTFFFTAAAGVVQYFLLIFCNKVVDYTLDIVRTDGRFFGRSTPRNSGLRRSCLQTALRWQFVFFVFVVVAVVLIRELALPTLTAGSEREKIRNFWHGRRKARKNGKNLFPLVNFRTKIYHNSWLRK